MTGGIAVMGRSAPDVVRFEPGMMYDMCEAAASPDFRGRRVACEEGVRSFVKRPVEPRDILNFRFLSRPLFSPDGTRIAFFVHKGDLETNRYASDIWLCDPERGETRRVTTSGREKFFCWSGDGSELLFASDRQIASDREETPKGRTRLYAISPDGGEARLLCAVARDVTSIRAVDATRALVLAVFEPEYDNPEQADYMVFESIPFCSNGKGFTGGRKTALCLCDLTSGALKRLTPEDMDVERYRLSPDGTRVLAVGPVFRDVRTLRNTVLEIGLNDGTSRVLLDGDKTGFACKCADYAPWLENGEEILVLGSDFAAYGVNQNAKFHALWDGKLTCITPELDRGLRNSIATDCRYGCADLNLSFFRGAGKAWFVSAEGYRSVLERVDAAGTIEWITKTLSTVDDYDVSGDRAAVVGMQGNDLQELYLADAGGERRLTDFNRTVLENVDVIEPEHVTVDNGTDEPLDAWVMKPVGFVEGRKYPAILNIHGGPKMAFGDIYVHEMQCWAAKGYVVLYANPRGSDGRGNAFDDIRGKYGAVDYDDLMAVTDWAIAKLPFVDADRMGVTGGSYGGYMTNWIIGHTTRFRAAVAQRSISNWISKAGISDIGYYFVPDQQAADIWTDEEKLWWHSPLKYADRAKTPTLFIHSDEDHRCELTQGLQMFSALKRCGVPSRICVFKGENHELSRSGRPKPRLARLREIIAWFERYLKD